MKFEVTRKKVIYLFVPKENPPLRPVVAGALVGALNENDILCI